MNTRTEKAATQYFGETARGYEARRVSQVKWQREQAILEAVIADLPEGVSVLDVPCGTGRLFKAFTLRRLHVTAIDISPDMLAEARAKAPYEWIALMQGSIFDICAAGQAFHTAFAIRIMNRISETDVPRALAELQRVTRERVVFNLRVDSGDSR
ncbi:MAG: class I SAM-dependent DNA methyltransferase, partial [Dichotomicrobium sp.]